ncbi:MAG: hypothetical protein K2N72_10610 [Oscillospiraceae bacterium]|nr:hypothetical protein [Oscillospiraceae bacterium]
MKLPKKNLRKNKYLSIAAIITLQASLMLTACGEVDYPKDAEALPTYTTKRTAQVIYETDTSPETTEPPKRTTTETTTSQIFGTGDYGETAETSAPVSEVSLETAETTLPAASPSLEDLPEVGISEYYKGTQTMRTASTSVTTTQATSVLITSSETALTTAFDDEPITDDDDDLISDEEPELIETVSAVTASSELHELLTDGRKSKYTGRDIISHPQSYYSLGDADKALYDRVVTSLLNHESRLTFTSEDNITFEKFFDMYQLIYNDEYRLFYISNQIEYYTDRSTGLLGGVMLQYTYNAAQAEQMKSEINARCDEILSTVTPEMSDYEIVKLIHDSIVKGCTYIESDNMNTVYGCMVEGEALCQGYSRSFMYLCSEAGLVSYGVFGEANGPHMWNIVEMDGEYYHVDCTWDDPDKPERPDSVSYDYFGVTDSRIKELRDTEEYTYDIPAANGTKYRYYTYNNLTAKNIKEAEEIIRRETLAAAQTKSSTVQFMCTDDAAYSEISGQLFTNSGRNILIILEEIVPDAANPFNTYTIQHSMNDKTRVIKFYLEY